MSTLEKKIALIQIWELYYTLVKVNEGYGKVNVNGQIFHLRSSHIAQLLGILNDEDKTYFDNMQLEHLVAEFVR